MRDSRRSSARASLVSGSAGNLFFLYYPPSSPDLFRRDIVVIPPFAEEMNKSRRMLALFAQRLSAVGIGTLVFDLYGTGDSQGDFSQARWEIWLQDVEVAVNWLRSNGADQVHALGFRLGALLALDSHSRGNVCIESMTFWAPVISGQVAMMQFMRLRLAANMLEGGGKETSKSLKALFESGKSVEIAGYELAPELFYRIDELRLGSLIDKETPPIDWIDLVSDGGGSLSPASQRVVDLCASNGIRLETHVIEGPPFWSQQEITVVPGLLDKTTALLAEL